MRKGRHRYPEKYSRGRDKQIGVAFESRANKRRARRKIEKAGRKARRRK